MSRSFCFERKLTVAIEDSLRKSSGFSSCPSIEKRKMFPLSLLLLPTIMSVCLVILSSSPVASGYRSRHHHHRNHWERSRESSPLLREYSYRPRSLSRHSPPHHHLSSLHRHHHRPGPYSYAGSHSYSSNYMDNIASLRPLGSINSRRLPLTFSKGASLPYSRSRNSPLPAVDASPSMSSPFESYRGTSSIPYSARSKSFRSYSRNAYPSLYHHSSWRRDSDETGRRSSSLSSMFPSSLGSASSTRTRIPLRSFSSSYPTKKPPKIPVTKEWFETRIPLNLSSSSRGPSSFNPLGSSDMKPDLSFDRSSPETLTSLFGSKSSSGSSSGIPSASIYSSLSNEINSMTSSTAFPVIPPPGATAPPPTSSSYSGSSVGVDDESYSNPPSPHVRSTTIVSSHEHSYSIPRSDYGSSRSKARSSSFRGSSRYPEENHETIVINSKDYDSGDNTRSDSRASSSKRRTESSFAEEEDHEHGKSKATRKSPVYYSSYDVREQPVLAKGSKEITLDDASHSSKTRSSTSFRRPKHDDSEEDFSKKSHDWTDSSDKYSSHDLPKSSFGDDSPNKKYEEENEEDSPGHHHLDSTSYPSLPSSFSSQSSTSSTKDYHMRELPRTHFSSSSPLTWENKDHSSSVESPSHEGSSLSKNQKSPPEATVKMYHHVIHSVSEGSTENDESHSYPSPQSSSSASKYSSSHRENESTAFSKIPPPPPSSYPRDELDRKHLRKNKISKVNKGSVKSIQDILHSVRDD